MQKIKSYITNPIAIFSFLLLVISFLLLITIKFKLPDFYVDREEAFALAQTVVPSGVREATAALESISYKIFNNIFQLWGWLVSIVIFILCFKLKTFSQIKDLKIFEKKRFVYLWINLSYPIYCFCYHPAYMADLEKYVYNGAADSMGIPYFNMLFALLFTALMYYPLVNLLFFIVYNTKIKRKFYDFLLILSGISVLSQILFWFFMKFTYFHLYLNLFNLIWLLLIIYAIKLQIDKRS